jgi:hypothetical protein
MQEKFYTYMYLRQKDGTPYYIGKGCGDRAYSNNRTIHRPDADARIFIQCWESESEAFEMEKWYIRLFGRKDNGTGILRNRTDGGEGPSGAVRSEEYCEKMSAALRANPAVVEQRRRLGAARKGRVPTVEARRKTSERNRSRQWSAESRRKVSVARKDKRLSEEHCWKLSEAAKANPATVEQCRKMGEANVGRAHTPETRNKMSEAAKRRCERERRQRDQSTLNQLVLFYDPIHLSNGTDISGIVAA